MYIYDNMCSMSVAVPEVTRDHDRDVNPLALSVRWYPLYLLHSVSNWLVSELLVMNDCLIKREAAYAPYIGIYMHVPMYLCM